VLRRGVVLDRLGDGLLRSGEHQRLRDARIKGRRSSGASERRNHDVDEREEYRAGLGTDDSHFPLPTDRKLTMLMVI
jgi:hypothetical protein